MKGLLLAVVATVALLPPCAFSATTVTQVGKVRLLDPSVRGAIAGLRFSQLNGRDFDGCSVDPGNVYIGNRINVNHAYEMLLVAKQNNWEVLVSYVPEVGGRCVVRGLELQ
jgi:hypothetical protein